MCACNTSLFVDSGKCKDTSEGKEKDTENVPTVNQCFDQLEQLLFNIEKLPNNIKALNKSKFTKGLNKLQKEVKTWARIDQGLITEAIDDDDRQMTSNDDFDGLFSPNYNETVSEKEEAVEQHTVSGPSEPQRSYATTFLFMLRALQYVQYVVSLVIQ